MRTRLSGILAMAGIVALTLPSCVSSKKYKASQASLQQVRDDSAKLAQQVATLNGNLQTSQEQNASLQKSLDKTTADYNASNTKVQTYEGYFSKETEAMGRVSQELKDSLAAAGITESDLEQSNGILYVNLDENKVFKKGTTAVTKDGWLAITGLAAVLKTHDDVNVGVDNGYTATGAMPAEMKSPGKWATNGTAKKHHYVKHHTAGTGTATASAGSTADNSTASASGAKSTTPRKHVVRHYSKEGTGAWTSNGMSSKQKSAWMLKAARVNTVAGTMLKQGMPRVAIIAQRPPADGSANNGKIRVIVARTPAGYPQASSSSASSASNAAAGMDK